jgi:hypothetical protein
MPEGTNDPATGPSSDRTGPAAGTQTVLLLGIGGGLGLVLGILLSIGVGATYMFFNPMISSPRESLQVFNELNELRQQINQMNEEKQLKDQEKAEAVRQALSSVTSTVRLPGGGMPSGVAPTNKQGPESPHVDKTGDPYAEIDGAIEDLQRTQKVLNTILDMFSPKSKERPKDR